MCSGQSEREALEPRNAENDCRMYQTPESPIGASMRYLNWILPAAVLYFGAHLIAFVVR